MKEVSELPWHEARRRSRENWQVLATQVVPIADAAYRILARDCPALIDLPTYATSAMDGFAVAGEGPWLIVGEIKAGQPALVALLEGTAVRISTGAVIPENCFGVIRWEYAKVIDEILHGKVEAGGDIRPAAYECHVGELLLSKGSLLNPSSVGLLAAAGYDEVVVTRKARVALILLGDEILLSGLPHDGLVRDALGPQLPGWLIRMGAEVIHLQYVADQLDLVIDAIAAQLSHCDLIITTGGTADGARDHIHDALTALDGELIVDRVKVRPGHPMLLAMLINEQGRKIPLLGLPGNPQSAITALLTLGEPVLATLQGRCEIKLNQFRSRSEVSAPPDFSRLLLGNIVDGEFEMGEHLGSAMLRGLAQSSGFAVVHTQFTPIGALVEWLPLP